MIEGGVEIVAENIGSDDFPLIDLIAKDHKDRPLLLHAGLQPSEDVLINAGAQMNWFSRNTVLLGKVLPELDLNKFVLPRAALIYPEFSQRVKRFVRAAPPSLPIMLYQYRCFDVSGKHYLYLEKAIAEKETKFDKDTGHREGLAPFRPGITRDDVEITPEEREAFFY
jgi:hypothetical protein